MTLSRVCHVWKDYGYFQVNALIEATDISETRHAIEAVVARLRTDAVNPDVLRPAREPMLQRLANALKSNGAWLSLVSRSQSQRDRVAPFTVAADRLRAVTAVDLQVVIFAPIIAWRYCRLQRVLTHQTQACKASRVAV